MEGGQASKHGERIKAADMEGGQASKHGERIKAADMKTNRKLLCAISTNKIKKKNNDHQNKFTPFNKISLMRYKTARKTDLFRPRKRHYSVERITCTK